MIAKQDLEWLVGLTKAVADKARVAPGQTVDERQGANQTGGALITPGGRYPAFWVRDYAMSLDAGFFSESEQLHMLLLTARRQQASDWIAPSGSLVPRGSIADHITMAGRPIYFPGTYDYEKQGGAWGKLPALDDHFYFVRMAHYYVHASGKHAVLETLVDGMTLLERLILAYRTPPARPDNGLVSVNDSNRGVSFGFTDTVCMTGDLLMASVLKFEAARQLADLCRRAGQNQRAVDLQNNADRIAAALPKTFGMQSGWLRAATGLSAQADVWGTAYAVYCGAIRGETALNAARALAAGYEAGAIACRGQIRHVPKGEEYSAACLWERMVGSSKPNRYQNGGYWGTPTGWVCHAINRVNPELAQRLAGEYIADLRATDFRRGAGYGGPYEWIYPPSDSNNPVYMTTVTCPLAVFQDEARSIQGV